MKLSGTSKLVDTLPAFNRIIQLVGIKTVGQGVTLQAALASVIEPQVAQASKNQQLSYTFRSILKLQ